MKSWDFSGMKDNDDYEPIPAGIYKFILEYIELKQSSTGKDMYSLEWVKTEKPFMNRKLWQTVLCTKNDGEINPFFRLLCSRIGCDISGVVTHDMIMQKTGIHREIEIGIETYFSKKENKEKIKNSVIEIIKPSHAVDSVEAVREAFSGTILNNPKSDSDDNDPKSDSDDDFPF